MRAQSAALSKLSTYVATCVTMYAGTAASDTDPVAKANNLFEAGQSLLAAGKTDQACDAFAESLSLDPQLGTRLNLADCREQQGRFVEAYELFSASAETAARTNKTVRLSFARQRMSALSRKVVTVKFAVATPKLDGLVIELDGQAVPPARWSAGMHGEARTIVVRASAPGYTPYHAEIAARPGTSMLIEVPALTKIGEAPADPALGMRAVVSTTSSWSPLSTLRNPRTPYVIAGAGGALVVTGILLGLHARGRYNDELALGGPGLDSRLDGPQHEADVGTALGVAGVTAIAAGVVLYVRARRSDRIVVTPTVNANGAGVAVTGAMW